MSHNCLTSLPTGLGYLHRLTRLAASDNRLEGLPDEIGSMTSEWGSESDRGCTKAEIDIVQNGRVEISEV